MNITTGIGVAMILGVATAGAAPATNAEIVKNFYDQAFNQFHPKEAAIAYLSEAYVQHNPYVATGRQAFIDAFANEKPEAGEKTIFVRTISEGDLVVLHSHKFRKAGDRGVAGIDIFRVQNGKIIEHWDVNQPIPEKSANTNTMF